MKPDETPRRVRFGPFEADFHTQELAKHGVKLKLSGQPLQVLEVLAARPGQMVSRRELQQLLWPGQVFVDASHGLNAAVNRLREALCDSANEPRYIETLPRRGYRFIGSLETLPVQPASSLAEYPPLGTPISLAPLEPAAKSEFAKPAAPPATVATSQADRERWFARSTVGRRPVRSRILASAALLSIAAALGFVVIALLALPSHRAENFEQQRRKFADEQFAGSAETRTAGDPTSARLTTTADRRKKSAEPAVARGPRLPADDQRSAPEIPADARSAAGEGAPQPSSLRLHPVIWGDGENAAPQFSPDGKRIAFMSNRDGPWQIWVSNIDGSQPRQVSFTESAGTPRWSPDGRSIAFDAPFDGGTWIFVVRVDQNDRAEPIVPGLVPSFSRDGKWIYFASDRSGDWQVWKIPSRRGTEIRGSGVEVTFKGGFAALESTDGYLYYSKSRYPEPEICRTPIQGGEESCSLSHLRPRTWASWATTRAGIVFAEDLPGGQPALSLYDPAHRQVRDLLRLESAPFWVGASFDGRRAMVDDASERQISMVDNLR